MSATEVAVTTIFCGVDGAVSSPPAVIEPAEADHVTLVFRAPVTCALNWAEVVLTVTLVGPVIVPTTTGITLTVVLNVALVPTVFVDVNVNVVEVFRIPVG